ncbi:putative cinnamoyl-CoA reductase [Rosa chinensis]|uniref:Putative cinnamoyl-CoA reductase n=1 Tax=Rosa chinensis TaxID=74649 RepID=A0A2P6PBT7_ROSCH|nr:cinnamoyl-CoA reductase 1 [Rosa chinensis]PRQ19391.1 putative cinnamoyl-CoA reductase [Rosa chinensis]
MGEKDTVCVTGAGGFVASWVVKLLLSQGYKVHGTARDPGDEKNAHLKKLENASENLQLFKADLFDVEGLCNAISGCSGVFHVACPVPSDEVSNSDEREFIEPAVRGTRNVLDACIKAKVKRVVVVSSAGAVIYNPKWPKDKPMDEECWSDPVYCKKAKTQFGNYCLAKTMAETEALEYAKKSELRIITVCPSFVFGPMLQSTLNASNSLLITLLKDGLESVENRARPVVDVRDVAEALLLAYEEPEAEGRYICTSYVIKVQALVEMLKGLYPNYNYPKRIIGAVEDVKMSSEKLQKLGWKFRPLEETIVDAVNNYMKQVVSSANKD